MEESAEVLGEERHERRAVSQSIVGSAGCLVSGRDGKKMVFSGQLSLYVVYCPRLP